MKKILIFIVTAIFITGWSSCNTSSPMPDGWYHVQKGEADSIIGEAIVTVDDFTALKLDSSLIDATMYYTIAGRIRSAKAEHYLDAVETLIGKQMGFVYKGQIVCNPSPNMRFDNPYFSIGSRNGKLIMEIYEDIRHKQTIEDYDADNDIVDINGIKMTAREGAAIEASMDSLLNAEGRIVLPNTLMLPDSILSNESIMSDPDFDAMKYYTPEQRKLSKMLAQVYLEGVKLDGSKLVVNMSREDAIKKGLPAIYYDYIVQSINDANTFYRLYKASPERIASEWEQSREEYKQVLSYKPE